MQTEKQILVTESFLRIFERRAEMQTRILVFMGGAVLGTFYGLAVGLMHGHH